MKMVTVFTPTYNRAYCLDRLYESLCQQTEHSFTWLIVDDGSKDNTEETVNRYIAERKIDIRYYKKENGGKHTAHNLGVELCDTELFICVDSDDKLTPNAIEVIVSVYRAHQDENLLGMYFRKKTLDGRLLSTPYPAGIDRVGISELYHRYRFQGDMVIVLKTECITPYRFPVIKGERFMTEVVFYNMLNHIAPMLLRDEAIYEFEYLEDGYTQNAKKLVSKNPYGMAIAYLSEAKHEKGLMAKCKQYARYRSIVNVFSLDKRVLRDYNHLSVLVKTASLALLPHYNKLYQNIKESGK
ncbi:MAG: glycosyltransferase family 2 protein [Ruminococcaceae bacterium]|nr:glycosyltransferase family 2 protein [Oscillospiraceae bacterium]